MVASHLYNNLNYWNDSRIILWMHYPFIFEYYEWKIGLLWDSKQVYDNTLDEWQQALGLFWLNKTNLRYYTKTRILKALWNFLIVLWCARQFRLGSRTLKFVHPCIRWASLQKHYWASTHCAGQETTRLGVFDFPFCEYWANDICLLKSQTLLTIHKCSIQRSKKSTSLTLFSSWSGQKSFFRWISDRTHSLRLEVFSILQFGKLLQEISWRMVDDYSLGGPCAFRKK